MASGRHDCRPAAAAVCHGRRLPNKLLGTITPETTPDRAAACHGRNLPRLPHTTAIARHGQPSIMAVARPSPCPPRLISAMIAASHGPATACPPDSFARPRQGRRLPWLPPATYRRHPPTARPSPPLSKTTATRQSGWPPRPLSMITTRHDRDAVSHVCCSPRPPPARQTPWDIHRLTGRHLS